MTSSIANEISSITHCSPLTDRWGGWYVTGTHGDQAHRGNLIGAQDSKRGLQGEKP